MSVNIILLEKVENLGSIGDTVSVKPGYARNFLLPQGKALRATKDNVAYFEKEKAAIEKVNAEKRADAEKIAKTLESLTVNIIRQASEGGQLYGAINARDIAEAVSEKGTKIRRGMVDMNQTFKTIGLFDVNVILHPEVIVAVQLNVARSEDEAAIQLETGEAAIVDHQAENAVEVPESVDEATAEVAEELLEDSALKAKQAAEEAEAQAAAEEAVKAAEEATKAEAASANAEEVSEETAEVASEEADKEEAKDA